MARTNYYEGLAADYSRPGLVSEELKAKLIQRSAEIGVLQESTLPAIGPDYTLEGAENREFWPTHCEALRQGRGDLLTKEYRPDLVYHCQDGPYHGITEQQKREKHWWAVIAQRNVTMVWPIVQFWGEFTHLSGSVLTMSRLLKEASAGYAVATGEVVTIRVNNSRLSVMYSPPKIFLN